MYGGGTADRVDADLGQTDVAHVARVDQLGDRADRLLDRDLLVQARGAVDVDVVCSQALQAVGQGGLDRGWARVVAEPGAVGPALGAELDADYGLVAVACRQ